MLSSLLPCLILHDFKEGYNEQSTFGGTRDTFYVTSHHSCKLKACQEKRKTAEKCFNQQDCKSNEVAYYCDQCDPAFHICNGCFSSDDKGKLVYGPWKYSIPHFNITDAECKSLGEQKIENWVHLPESIYGAAICFLIVSRESFLELRNEIDEKQKETDEFHRAEDESILNNFKAKYSRKQIIFFFKFIVMLGEIIITFLIQGILIYKVYDETPPPSSDTSGFCIVAPALQIGAIAALTLWTVSAFGDIWTEGKKQ